MIGVANMVFGIDVNPNVVIGHLRTKMRSFCLCLSPKPRAAERDPKGVGARPHCLHGSPEVCSDVDDGGIGNDELPKSLILV